MRKVTRIFSERKLQKHPAWEIVYEWEDILSDKLNIPICVHNELKNKFRRRFEKNNITNVYHKFHPKGNITLTFVMMAETKKLCKLNNSCIPVIIDFWLDKNDLPAFFDAYKHVPLILVTNKEICTLLRNNGCPVPVEHWALSYPDIYAFNQDTNYAKEYEFSIIGRPNPFFIRMLDRYCLEHPDFKYIMNNGDIYNRKYINNRGEIVAEDKGRQSYLEMIKKTKISCYSTPGIDESKKDTNLYNQVTPRLFELLCNGCQVIGHYPNSEDVMWYKLNQIIPNVDNYTEFCAVLDDLRCKEADINRIKAFMEKHYTSVRVNQLVEVLRKHNILV